MAQLLDIHTHLHSTAWNSVYSLRLGVDSSTPTAPYSAAIHPWDCEVLWPLREELLALLEGLPVIAVGETGIDNVAKVDRDKQAEIFPSPVANCAPQAASRHSPFGALCWRGIAPTTRRTGRASRFPRFYGQLSLGRRNSLGRLLYLVWRALATFAQNGRHARPYACRPTVFGERREQRPNRRALRGCCRNSPYFAERVDRRGGTKLQ